MVVRDLIKVFYHFELYDIYLQKKFTPFHLVCKGYDLYDKRNEEWLDCEIRKIRVTKNRIYIDVE